MTNGIPFCHGGAGSFGLTPPPVAQFVNGDIHAASEMYESSGPCCKYVPPTATASGLSAGKLPAATQSPASASVPAKSPARQEYTPWSPLDANRVTCACLNAAIASATAACGLPASGGPVSHAPAL